MVRRARPRDAEKIHDVRVAMWRETYRGLVPDAFLDAMDQDREASVLRWRATILRPDPWATFVLDLEGEGVVGFAFSGAAERLPDAREGELYALYLLSRFHGRGFGRDLLQAARRHLEGAAYRSMRVWVLRENPSRLFYERLGGRKIGERTITIGGAALEEWAYGFDLDPG